jgi:hypothetical protein
MTKADALLYAFSIYALAVAAWGAAVLVPARGDRDGCGDVWYLCVAIAMASSCSSCVGLCVASGAERAARPCCAIAALFWIVWVNGVSATRVRWDGECRDWWHLRHPSLELFFGTHHLATVSALCTVAVAIVSYALATSARSTADKCRRRADETAYTVM